ncbi:hypothetical protein ACQKGD_10095 [Peribacillus frigoritolerans]|uniref:hypothetical protein n=1 Tax=Peribacillus frigoritolerans TaxID=450367 RepID=UPI00207AFE48|nr:glycogen branching protein [Peribacillus frigoritolerans]USK62845.1 glycogen branching protein [Peribacillus frigoritolerans]
MEENKVLEFNPYENIRFEVRNTKIEKDKGRMGIEVNEYATIVLVNKENKREVPHPLTSFIYDKWRFSRYNNQLARAKHLTTFLNHTLIEFYTLFKVRSISDLDVVHGVHFLEHKKEQGCSRNTLRTYDKTIIYFYEYLANKGQLKNLKKEDFEWTINYRTKKKTLKSLFIPKMQSLPAVKVDDTKARTLEEHHVIAFIRTAMTVANDIALGVYLAIFGGLRGSEVMSVKRSEIKKLGVYGENGLIVRLKTDSRVAKGSGNRVKSPGVQPIDAVKGLLQELYRTHLERYPAPKDGSDSLFVNSRGASMQYQTFNQKFKKVKKAFIEKLKESDNPDDKLYALNYQSLKWSTHIGRGTYSNNIAEECQHLIELMRARRDSSPESALPYLVNTKNSINQMNQGLEEMYEDVDR